MITIKFDKRFLKEFKKLSSEIQQKLIYLEDVFKVNPFEKNLQTKRLQGKLKNFYSFRITREYRVIFQFISFNEVVFLAVKHRKDIYKKQ